MSIRQAQKSLLLSAVKRNSSSAAGGAGRFALVSVPLVFLALFFYAPLLRLLWQSLANQASSPLLATLQDGYFWHLLQLTLKQAALSALASTLLGLPLGYILANYRLPLPRLWRALVIVPFVLPAIVVALGFILFFGYNGYLNRTLFAVLGVRLPVLYSLSGIVLAHAFYNAPIVARTTAVAWERIDPALEQAARSLGASPWRIFTRVTWPILQPAVLSGALLAFIFAFFSFPLVLSLGGARFTTLEVEVYTQVRVLLDYGTGAAFAFFATLASLGLTFLYLQVEAHNRVRQRIGRPRVLKHFFSRGVQTLPLWFYLLFLALLYLGPIVSVIYDSLKGDGGKLSLASYSMILQAEFNPQVGESPLLAVLNSLRFGLAASLLAVGLGTALAMGLAHMRGKRARILETLAMAPLAVSSVAFGFAILRAYRMGALHYLGIGPAIAIVVAHATLGLPFVLRILRPHFQSFDRNLQLASRSLGANAQQTFFQVELPLSAAALLTAAVFAFSMSVAEMSATIMLAQPGMSTMPLSVYHLVSARQFSAAAAMAVLMMLIMTMAFGIIDAVGQKLATRQSRGQQGVFDL